MTYTYSLHTHTSLQLIELHSAPSTPYYSSNHIDTPQIIHSP